LSDRQHPGNDGLFSRSTLQARAATTLIMHVLLPSQRDHPRMVCVAALVLQGSARLCSLWFSFFALLETRDDARYEVGGWCMLPLPRTPTSGWRPHVQACLGRWWVIALGPFPLVLMGGQVH